MQDIGQLKALKRDQEREIAFLRTHISCLREALANTADGYDILKDHFIDRIQYYSRLLIQEEQGLLGINHQLLQMQDRYYNKR